MSAEATDGGEDQYRADCGHLIGEGEGIHDYELVLCEECYTPFEVDEWPDQLGKYEHRVIEGNRRTSTTINHEYLLGLDRRGRAVYYDEENCRVRTYVPMHDSAYREDRRQRAEQREQWHTPEKGLGVLRPKKFGRSKPAPAPAIPGDFVTLPNGDHIVEVETTEKIKSRELDEWMEEHADGFKQMRPNIVKRFGLEDQFGTESGKPLVDMECRECEERIESVDRAHYSDCPVCGSHKFHPAGGDE